MANIVLTNLCNLCCPYCFASELRSEDIQFLSQENLEEIKDFLQRSDVQEVGLIGGEPTLHPKFAEIATQLAECPQFRKVCVYTNGIRLSRFFPQLCCTKICYLVNVNDPREIGYQKYNCIVQMLETAKDNGMLKQISLGVNVYKADADFDFVLSLCSRFGFSALRLSVVVPENAANLDRNSYFMGLKPTLMALYHQMKELGIVPKYDCNIIPACLFTPEEAEFLRLMPGSAYDLGRITGEYAVCHPVIDIYPDLSVARCFGMSHLHEKKIRDFQTLNDIIRYFVFRLDGKLLYSDTSPDCRICYQRQVLRCYGGCIAFLQKGDN